MKPSEPTRAPWWLWLQIVGMLAVIGYLFATYPDMSHHAAPFTNP